LDLGIIKTNFGQNLGESVEIWVKFDYIWENQNLASQKNIRSSTTMFCPIINYLHIQVNAKLTFY